MIYKKLPNDLKSFIKTFIFGKCEHCGLKHYYWQLKFNIILYEYVSIFSDIWDDYYIYDKNPLKFEKICDYCYQDFDDSSCYVSNLMLQI